MDLASISMGVAVFFMLLMLLYQIKIKKQIEETYVERRESDVAAESVRFLRILRTCGFPSIVNPRHETHKDLGERRLWYFKAAMKIKNYDLEMFSQEQYQTIKSIVSSVGMPRSFSLEAAIENGFEDNKVLSEVFLLASAIHDEIETTNREVFDDAETLISFHPRNGSASGKVSDFLDVGDSIPPKEWTATGTIGHIK